VVEELNVVIVGVGGQGQLFLSRLIAEVFARRGIGSLVAETHGMSQRGGSVIVHVRVGRRVKAPLIPIGGAHVMLGMELIESTRYLDYLRVGGVALVNEKMIRPTGQVVRLNEGELVNYILSRTPHLVLLSSSREATKLGVPVSANVHMFGAFAELMELAGLLEGVDDVVPSLLPRRQLELNLRLYRMGREELRGKLSRGQVEGIKKVLVGGD
jgi:indolepyruvate ferredoxin oxidoreductase beta subunit